MTNKFPIGSQWKTRAGHRAMIVSHRGGIMRAYHESDDVAMIGTKIQSEEGLCVGPVGCDLLTPWDEPRKGTFWVNVYPDGTSASDFKSKESADDSADTDRIACVRVDWTEGEGL